MTTRHLIDPELLAGLELMPTFSITSEILPMLRQGMEEMAAAQPPQSLPVEVEERDIAGGDGQQMRVKIYRPERLSPEAGAILQIHGGGYIMGSARLSDAGNRLLADQLGVIVAAVDYRLAPETPHPGPVEDCYAALKWLESEARDFGVNPARIAVKGESAGGGLAAALALLARDRGGPRIAHQHLIYPMIDDRTGAGGETHPICGEFVWTAEANRFGWQSLLGSSPGGETVSAYAAAARAIDLAGLPPTFIAVGALDLFLEEDIDYARRLLRAGVPTELHVYPGAYHGFDVNAGAAVVQEAWSASIAALRRAFQRAI